MSKKHYDEATVLRELKLKGCSVSQNGLQKSINVPYGSKLIGIRSLGKIDFLCHYCGYSIIKKKVSAIVEQKEDIFTSIVNKAKKETKTVKLKKTV